MLIFVNNERLYMIDHYVDSTVSIITWRVIMLIFNNERLYMIDHYVDLSVLFWLQAFLLLHEE
jgi:hypothetical protein